jgi:hypothetical protein
MVVEVLECHPATGQGFVAGALMAGSVRVPESSSSRLDELQAKGLRPGVITEFCPPGTSFFEPDGGQIRLSLTDVSSIDTEELAEWLRAIFTVDDVEVWGNITSVAKARSDPWHDLAHYLLEGEGSPFVMMSSRSRGIRPQVVRLTVPTLEWAAPDGDSPRPRLRTRILVLFVVAGVVLDIWRREDTRTQTDKYQPDSSSSSLWWATRSAFSSGPDGKSPGDIANHYVLALLSRYADIIRSVDNTLERWETDFFAVAANVSAPTHIDQLLDIRLISDLRTTVASIRGLGSNSVQTGRCEMPANRRFWAFG